MYKDAEVRASMKFYKVFNVAFYNESMLERVTVPQVVAVIGDEFTV